MANYANLPVPSPEGGLNRYLQEIRKFPLLEPEEEYMLAKRWVEEQDTQSAHRLVTSHLRLAAKIAMGYRGYGLPQAEVISEANVGLMQAVKRFDPEKGFRLATYAMDCAVHEMHITCSTHTNGCALVRTHPPTAPRVSYFNID